MDATNPYPESDKPTKKPKARPPKEGEERDNDYRDLVDDDEEDLEEDDYEDDLDDDEGEYEDEPPWFKRPIGLIALAVGVILLVVIVYFLFLKKDTPPPAPTEQEVEQALDPTEILKGELYKKGIGKDAIDEKNIYEQGSIESSDFRRDFVNTDSPENYALPINIVAVNDSVSYTKHRTMTDDGMDMYWADAMYKDKKTRFTIPYYIWQTLAPQGVMDVIAEVVTDAEGKTFVTSITAVPPSEED